MSFSTLTHPVTAPTLASSTAAARPAALPEYWREHQHWLIDVPVRVVAIFVVAVVVRFALRRAIARAVSPSHGGGTPRLLRPFKDRLDGSRLLESAGLNSERRRQRAETLGSVLKSAVSVIVFVVASMMIIDELGFDLGPFIAGTSIVGVALGFGAQNIVKDFLSGMFMLMEDQYGVGDIIDFEQASGTVEAVGLRVTQLRDVDGVVWYVRNGEVIRVGNKSQGFATVVLDVPIEASADVAEASATMLDTSQAMAAEDDWQDVFLSEPEVQGVEAMTRFETTIRVVARVRPLEQWRTAREMRGRIRRALDELDVRHRAASATSAAGPARVDPDSVIPSRSDDDPGDNEPARA